MANLAIIRREGLVDRARHVGARLSHGFAALAADGVIDHTRGDGAMWAVGLHEGQDPLAVRDRLFDLGVVCRGIPPNTLTFCPPLVITDEHIDRIVDAVATAAAGR